MDDRSLDEIGQISAQALPWWRKFRYERGSMPKATGLAATIGGAWRRYRGRPRHGVEVSAKPVFLGTEYGGYAVLPDLVPRGALVYSAGLGEDISFDLALIERFGCVVHGFDPTPRSLAWLAAQKLPPGYFVHGYGIAHFDGTASFAPPKNPAHVSHSTLAGHEGERIEFPVKRLSSVLAELGHERVELMKLDIEGSEYEVLADLVKTVPLPRQLMVEFHHGMGGVSLEQTEGSLELLREAGYRVFDARVSGREFSLVRDPSVR
jgi:FkbM family methyltransferase